MITGFDFYTDKKITATVARHNFEVASGIRKGELQFNRAFVDLERTCNLACHGCFKFLDRDKTRKKLSYDEITDTIDFANERGAKVISIAGAGEPTLDSDFRKIIQYTNKKGMFSVVFTNGSMLNRELCNFLFDNAVSPIVKKFAVDYDKQDFLIGKQGISRRMQEGLETLIEVKEQREKDGKRFVSEIAIDCYISRENLEDIPDVLRYCRNNGFIPYIETFVTIGQTTSKLIPSQNELDGLFEQLAKIDQEEFEITTPLIPGARVYGEAPCTKRTTGFAVDVDGNVFECISGSYNFGNIRNQSLKEMFDLNNQKTRQFYSAKDCSKCVCSGAYKNG